MKKLEVAWNDKYEKENEVFREELRNKIYQNEDKADTDKLNLRKTNTNLENNEYHSINCRDFKGSNTFSPNMIEKRDKIKTSKSVPSQTHVDIQFHQKIDSKFTIHDFESQPKTSQIPVSVNIQSNSNSESPIKKKRPGYQTNENGFN